MQNDKIVQQAKDLLVGEKISIAIVGSRSFKEFDQLKTMDEFIKSKIDVDMVNRVVSGGATGADFLAMMWANAHSIETLIFPADWKMYGRAAGFIRNRQIIEAADVVFAFWDGRSKGTKNSIKISKEMEKKLYIHIFDND